MARKEKGDRIGAQGATGGKPSAAPQPVTVEGKGKKAPLAGDAASGVGVGGPPGKRPPPAIIINGDQFPAPKIPEGLRKAVEKQGALCPYEYDRTATMEYVCELIACGKSLLSICKLEGMPTYAAIMKWLNADSELVEMYERAHLAQAGYLAEETIELADNCRLGQKRTVKDGEVEVVTADMVERTRLQIDARKWYAAKLNPRKYGDRLQTDVNVQVETHEERLQRLTGRAVIDVTPK